MKDTNDPNEFLKNLLGKIDINDPAIQAQLNDQRLLKVAQYEATRGYLDMGVSQDAIQEKFIQYKVGVSKGSYSIKALEDDVYTRNGIQEEDRTSALRNEADGELETNKITGFRPDDLDVADIPYDSPENH